MKDLYAKLGIDPGASEAQVTKAMEAVPEMSVYEPILLNEEKRAFYDHAYAVLKVVGVLRHSMNLDSDGSWFLQHNPDFVPRLRSVSLARKSAPGQAGPTVPAPDLSTPQQAGGRASAGGSRRLGLLLAGIVIVALAVAALLWF